MKILPAFFIFLTASAVGQSISPPTRADLAPSTQEVTVDEARPISDISARGLGKLKDIFDKVKEKGDDKDKKIKDKKPKDKTENKKGEDKKDGKELTKSKILSKKKFKFKGFKKGKGKGKGKGGGGDIESMAAADPKAPLLFVGALFILAVPLMVP